ncbi:MAG: oatA 5, partial [Acidimicrobiia bacterium]|nr:oatA 5 [Acidimicrobiia bacterium]
DLQVAIVQVGPWDVADRRLPGDRAWRHPGDPVYDRYLLGEMNGVLDMFAARGVAVVWLTSPEIESGRADVPRPSNPYPESDPARMRRFNELLTQAAASRPAVHVVDLAGHLASLPGGELDPALRPDGVHFTLVTARQVADWLGPAVVAAIEAR